MPMTLVFEEFLLVHIQVIRHEFAVEILFGNLQGLILHLIVERQERLEFRTRRGIIRFIIFGFPRVGRRHL